MDIGQSHHSVATVYCHHLQRTFLVLAASRGPTHAFPFNDSIILEIKVDVLPTRSLSSASFIAQGSFQSLPRRWSRVSLAVRLVVSRRRQMLC